MNINETEMRPVALTIAGFDPSGGAGVIADIQTFTAFDCLATAAVTSLTFQNSSGVFGASHQTAEAVRAQVLPLIEEFRIACVKTGMLPTREIVSEVARLFRETALPAPVVDTVIRSTSGYDLIDVEALDALVKELFPLSRLVTPNIPEAERITGLRITDTDGMLQAARSIRRMGARAVLIKGGHLERRDEGKGMRDEERDEAIDVLDDDGRVSVFRGGWIEETTARSTRGTGCTLAAATAAGLAHGHDLETAIAAAKRFVELRIKAVLSTEC
ncbi:MAG: bifunctional hydroxymethylpyrimidine kinase/phosphomethylpyrimidine kinase [Pyrinomonadaceae bacterium]